MLQRRRPPDRAHRTTKALDRARRALHPSLLILSPFLIGGWFGLSIWRGREPRRRTWLYAFTDGFVLSDDPRASAFPVRWSQVTDVSVIWTVAYEPGAEGEGRPVVSGYRLRCTDGQALEISRSFQNVRDPYGE